TEIAWQLPEGVQAGEIIWPVPMRIELPADLVDFGYEDEIFLLTRLSIPENFAMESLAVQADVVWLECEVICIPSGATVSLEVPMANQASAVIDQRWADGFAQTLDSLPRDDISFDAMFNIAEGEIKLLVQATEPVFENAASITFFPGEHRVFDYNAEQQITHQLSSMQLSQAYNRRVEQRGAPETISGVILVSEENGQQTAYDILAQPEGVSLSALGGAMNSSGSSGIAGMSLLLVFTFAMLGGVILNLMPCVLPVLSLKVMNLSASSGGKLSHQRLHGLAYTAGVILSFLALASVLLGLQAGGAAIGWGFQLQSPWFVGALVYLFFILGLSLSGVVEFGTSVMGVGSELQDQSGYKGSFFTGILEAVVASPCTAPFMGAALGFAFTQSMPVALTVFVALGFGMALPFLLIAFIPALANLMPKPGKWMVTFKQFLAFPLYATAVWLLWVLGQQTSTNGMALVIGACVLLAFATWLYQKRREAGTFWRYANAVLILLSVAGAFAVLQSPFLETRTGGTAVADAEAGFEPYSAARLQELRAESRPVFINMTASWCITCLVNERVALSSDTIMTAMAEKNVTYLKGDWTNNDPAITEVLKQYETSGVPLYLMFPADSSKPAEVLPQILTESIMLDALERI
ncbi:MAG: thioredoxin family protein, partial [Pseudohongiellaceae bacterium]